MPAHSYGAIAAADTSKTVRTQGDIRDECHARIDVRSGGRDPVVSRVVSTANSLATLVISCTLVLGACSQREPSATAPAERAPVTQTVWQTSAPQARQAAFENSFRAIEEGERDSPRDRWDPGYVIEQIGHDPRSLFAWVRDNTHWIPYRGVLRGPVGVLMDRQGNSLDRALLLATLLQKSGQAVRLAHGELTREQALGVLPTLLAARGAAVAFASTDTATNDGSDTQSAAADYQLDGAAIERTLDAQTTALMHIAHDLDARVSDQTQRLLSSIARPDRTTEWRNRFEAALTSLRDHWWVQWLDGTWRDLDVVAVDGTGPMLATPSETLELEKLEPSLRHEIVVRVVIEQASGNAFAQRRVLEHALRPAELIGQPIVLQFWPNAWPSDIATDNPDSKYGVRAAALEQREWSVALLIGPDVAVEATLRDDGGEPRLSAANPYGGLGGGILNAAPGPRSTPATELTAAWIEYELRSPGEPPRTIRRVVFDVLGAAARTTPHPVRSTLDDSRRLERSLALMMRTEILAAPCRLAPQYVTHLAAQSLLANRDLFRSILRSEFSLESAASKALLDAAVPPLSPLYLLALSRLEWSGQGSQVLIDRPTILSRHRFLAARTGAIAMVDATDIVANEVGVDLTSRDGFAVRLEQGVFDTNAEALLHANAPAVGNTASAFALSRDWSTMTAAPGNGGNRGFSDDVQHQLAQDLNAGYVVVAPRVPVQMEDERFVGWWRIDPTTGSALGVAGNGWGAAMTEDSALKRVLIQMGQAFAYDNALCVAIPQVLNATKAFVHHEMPWWGVGEAQHPYEVAEEHTQGCMIAAMITTGVTATLPFLIMQLGPFLRQLHGDIRGGARVPPKLGGPPANPPTVPIEPPLVEPPATGPKQPGSKPPPHPPEPPLKPFDPTKTDVDPHPPVPDPRPPVNPRPTGKDVRDAEAAADDARNRFMQAVKDGMEYRNKKEVFDDPTWDRAVDRAYEARSRDAYNESREAREYWEQLLKNFKNNPPNQGGGFPKAPPPANPPPPPNAPGCPPNCGSGNGNGGSGGNGPSSDASMYGPTKTQAGIASLAG